MNILFICSRNIWRSPTAEAVYKGRRNHHVKSAGTEPSAKVRVSARNILWADIVFVMEKKHKQRLTERYPDEMQGKNVVVLDIEDDYGYMNEELVNMITVSVDPYLG